MKKIYTIFAAVAAFMLLCVNAQAQGANPDYFLGQKGWVTVEEYDNDYKYQYTYDDQGRQVKELYYEYGAFKNTITHEYGANSRTTYVYDTSEQLEQRIYIEFDDKTNTKVIYSDGTGFEYSTSYTTLNGNIYTQVTTMYDEETRELLGTWKKIFEIEVTENQRIEIEYNNFGSESNPIYEKRQKTVEHYEFGEYMGGEFYLWSDSKQDWELSETWGYTNTRNADGYISQIVETDVYGRSEVRFNVSYETQGKNIVATATMPDGYEYKAIFCKLSDISSINNVIMQKTEERMYNIQGQRVGADHRGITIINGKKVLLRR